MIQCLQAYLKPFFEYNLSDIHFGSLATPISAVFEVQLASSVQNLNPIDVSVYACDLFDELSITFVNSPSVHQPRLL